MDAATWEKRLRSAPVWTDASGRRCIRLPNGVLYAKTDSELAEVAVELLSAPERFHNSDRIRIVLDRLLSPEEWALAETIVADVAPVVETLARSLALASRATLN